MQGLRRPTVYFDPGAHRALRAKSAATDRSISDLVGEAVRLTLAEDADDLSTLRQRAIAIIRGFSAHSRPQGSITHAGALDACRTSVSVRIASSTPSATGSASSPSSRSPNVRRRTGSSRARPDLGVPWSRSASLRSPLTPDVRPAWAATA